MFCFSPPLFFTKIYLTLLALNVLRGEFMPVCNNCGSRISKFDKDMCPICGALKPLEGVSSETIEITSEIKLGNHEFKNYQFTSRLITCLLFVFLGIFGAGFFYAKYKKAGLIWLIGNVVVIGGLGSILAFLTNMGILWGYLVPLFVCYFINIVAGLYFLLKSNLKDGNGEFMH